MKKLQRGLPKGRYSKYGYKRNSPDVNKPFNIIPSGNITMKDVDFPVKGIDNLGNEQIMYPGLNYIFPGSYVLEIPMMQPGGQKYYTPAAESTGANYTPIMTVQAAERLKTQRDAQELARRKQAIQASQAAASKPLRERLTPENLAQETGATGDKLRFFPNDPDSFIDDYLNPFKMVGDMASGLGRLPLNLKQGNYGQAAMSVATPLVVGATAGLGAKSAGQFVNNLANPLVGTGQFLTTKTPLKNAYTINPWAFKPKEGMMYRGIGKEGMEDAIQSGVFRQKAKRPPGIPDESGVRLRGKGFGETYFSPEFSVADRYGKGFIAEVPKKSGEFKMSDSPNHASGWSQYVESPIPISEGRILQKDWLRGYKKVPVKSAVGNVGFFDMSNPNIYKAAAPIGIGLGTTTTQEYQNGGYSTSPAPTYFGGTLPEVMVSSDDTSYPYYNKLTAEERKYFNQNSPIGRAVRSIASTGKRGETANDLGKIARGVEEFAVEMTGIPGSIRFSQDPVKKLKGLGRTVEATILGSSPFITAPYNKEDVADTFDALDALGFATTTAGLAKMPLQKAANLTGRYLAQGPTINIPKQLLGSSNALNLEELRRVYHNSERVLEPEEARFLHKHGHGLRENYRTSDSVWNNQQNFQEDAFRHIINRYNIPNNTRNLGDAARSLDASQKPQFLRNVLSEIPRLMSTDDLFRARINYQNSVNNIASTSTPRNKPLIKNKSGLTKEEALQKATAKDKDVISKMSENEFSNTVLKPTGEIVPYESQADLMPHFTGSNNVFAMSPKEYADEFNLKLDLLNDIIAQRNKSGVEYRVKGLDESGTLTFYTPPGQKGKNPLIKKGLEDIEIPAGESIWSVGINPGEWRGNVEDIANTQYFRSIPGLEMRNTTNTVFSDGVPRKGTGAYEAINEYLKRLDLGRVKPGFNSQTEFSRGAWENFIKSGRGVGFYGNPNTIYGTMKTIVPPAAIGVGAYGVNQKQDAQPTMQKFGGNLNFQFGGYIPSWLNPMNWGVTDYTGKKDFNSAYAAARQAGEKEFMWNGKRFNTDYKGTPQQQLKETGLTNEQIQDRSKLNKNLTKNIYPYSYDNLEKRIWAAGVLGKKEENREAIDKDPRPYDKEKLDALNLYAGVPQKNNTFRISNYKPSTSKDNINYYTFNKQDDRFVKNLIDYAYLKSKGAIDGSAKDYDIDVKGLVPDQEKNVMGNYKMSTGKDDRGTYVSFYDKWDLAPMDFGKPFEIYDRIYTKDYSDGKQKRMYYTDKELLELDINKKNFDTLALQRELANRGYKLSKSTKKDGIFDGILGEETKKALEDWQKKNFKKQFGGALLKAQFGAFGTIPTSPPFMPQKENVVTSKKVDNLPKIKVNTTVPDEMITIKDGRKIRLTTGQAINPNTDLVGKSYSTKALRSILNTAKNRGLSKNDALTLAAMDLQETRWGETDNNMGHVIYKNGFARSPAENFINAYLKSKETADRLKLSDEYTRLQVYNGLGKVTPNTEKDYHGFRMKKIYGVPVPESGIDMKKNPLYGKQIVDIRDNVLKQNSEFLKLVDEYYKMGGITNEMLDVYKNYINGVYTNTEKEKDAIKVYDKLNRKYYREAKNANKSVPNYIMSLIK